MADIRKIVESIKKEKRTKEIPAPMPPFIPEEGKERALNWRQEKEFFFRINEKWEYTKKAEPVFGIPTIKADKKIDEIENCIGFNYLFNTQHYDRTVHFFVKDYLFERVWNQPDRYLMELSKYKSVLSPNFSLFRDYPIAFQIYNVWRQRVLGSLWQDYGIKVVPSVNWSDGRSYDFAFLGIEPESPVVCSNLGAIKKKEDREFFIRGFEEMVKRLNPSKIYIFGHDKSLKDFNHDVTWLDYKWRDERKNITVREEK